MTDLQPDAIRARVHRAFELAGETPWLVGYDINDIQQLVTASSRPVAVRGASQAIQDFDNRRKSRPMSIFAGGGRGVELVSSEPEARALIQQLIAEFRRETQGGVLAAEAVTCRRDAQKASLTWLKRKLENAKDAAARPGGDLAANKEHQCMDCDAFRAEHRVDSGDEERQVCARCYLMIKAGREINETSRSLLDFAEHRRIAAISADGNNLGAFFASLSSLEELAAASEAIANIFRDAHLTALQQIAPVKALSPVTGGDDIRLFVAPDSVLPYVEALVRGVEERASRAGNLGGILPAERAQALALVGVGVGAVVAGDHYPAARLMASAHEMERSAKTICRLHSAAPGAAATITCRSAFDFALLTSESISTEDGRRSQPIAMDEATWIRTLASIEALRKVPPSQRAMLAERRSMSDDEFANLLCYQVARNRDWQKWFEASGVRGPE
jgi:hypothetical protein